MYKNVSSYFIPNSSKLEIIRCPSSVEWVSICHTVECCTAMGKNEHFTHATTRITLTKPKYDSICMEFKSGQTNTQ